MKCAHPENKGNACKWNFCPYFKFDYEDVLDSCSYKQKDSYKPRVGV